jgi:hypothetical protein
MSQLRTSIIAHLGKHIINIALNIVHVGYFVGNFTVFGTIINVGRNGSASREVWDFGGFGGRRHAVELLDGVEEKRDRT